MVEDTAMVPSCVVHPPNRHGGDHTSTHVPLRFLPMTIRSRDRKRAEANRRRHAAIIAPTNPDAPTPRPRREKQLTERQKAALQTYGKYVRLPGVLGAVETLDHLDKVDQFLPVKYI